MGSFQHLLPPQTKGVGNRMLEIGCKWKQPILEKSSHFGN